MPLNFNGVEHRIPSASLAFVPHFPPYKLPRETDPNSLRHWTAKIVVSASIARVATRRPAWSTRSLEAGSVAVRLASKGASSIRYTRQIAPGQIESRSARSQARTSDLLDSTGVPVNPLHKFFHYVQKTLNPKLACYEPV